MNIDVTILIKQYIDTIIGVDDIEVEIIEDTVVLSRDERWHIYIIPGRFTMIGCFVDEDIEISNNLRREAGNIQHIYESSREEDETIQ